MQKKQRVGLRFGGNFNSAFDDKKIEKYADYLVSWIKEKVKSAGCKGCVIGLSGGIDSAVTAALCNKAFPKNTSGIILPIDEMKSDIEDLEKLSKTSVLQMKTVNLKNTFNALKKELKDIKSREAIINIKPRLRMTVLYSYAKEYNYLVVGADNLDEYYIGYFTKYGDGAADIQPISQLLKSEVRALAHYLKIPESIINKEPSAGLWEGQNDESEFGFSYYELDSYLLGETKNIKKENLDKIKSMHKISDHKRKMPDRPLSIDSYFNNDTIKK